MNRMVGKLKLICLIVSLVVGQIRAQHHEPYPYDDTYDDNADYDDRHPLDNHHPLDNQGHYGYRGGDSSVNVHDSRDNNYDDVYNRRQPHEDVPEPRIITPPVAQENLSRNIHEDHDDRYTQEHSRDYEPQSHGTHESHDSRQYEPQSHGTHESHDNRQYESERSAQHNSRSEYPEPRIITPPVYHESDSNDMYDDHEHRNEHYPTDNRQPEPEQRSWEYRYEGERSLDEEHRDIPEPRIITPPVHQDSRSDNRNEHYPTDNRQPEHRYEHYPTDNRQPEPAPRSWEYQYEGERSVDEEHRDIPEPRIITPPVYQNSRSSDRNAHYPTDNRQPESEPRVTDYRYEEDRSIDEQHRDEDSRPHNSYEEHNTRHEEHRDNPSVYREPSHDSRSNNMYEEHNHREEPQHRDEFPVPRVITPPESQEPSRPYYPEPERSQHESRDSYQPTHVYPDERQPTQVYIVHERPQHESREPIHVYIGEESSQHESHDSYQPTHAYPEHEKPQHESHDEYQPSHVMTQHEPQEHSTHLTYEPLHGRDYNRPSDKSPHVISVPRLGSVRGYREFMTINNRPISAYLGLKYGTVRSGLGRFQQASPYQSDPRSVIEATEAAPNCPQFPDLSIVARKESMGENVDDCLTLDIYAPASSGSYPVIVFVHGEMLFDGSAEEGKPDYFLEHDVVLVNINYRLAPFGYLSTLTDEMPGNVALADIQMALEWVQQHISAFNGNSEQVTLMGQAAGSTLIHALSISGKAQGLFHKLILQSGTALNPYFLDEQPLSTLRSFATFARCPPSRTTEGYISCLESMSTSNLLTNFQRYFESNEPRGLAFSNAYKLIVGDKLGYLPQHPASMVSNNTYPMIVGVTKDAGAFIMSRFYEQLQSLQSRNVSDYIMVVLKHTVQPRHYQLWTNWALQHIFNPEEIRNPNIDIVVQKLLELTNLILYRAPVVDSIRYTSKAYPTYLYCFDYRGGYHRFGHLRNPLPFEIDATLSDDSIFLFPYPEDVSRLNGEDQMVSRKMVNMWVNFAQYGVPDQDPSVWPRVSSEYGPFLRFTNTQASKLEEDYHFGDGVPVPNLYPEYFTTTTTTTTTTPRPYRPTYPSYPQPRPQPAYPNYPQYPSNPQYPNHSQNPSNPQYPNHSQYPNSPQYPNHQQYPPNYPPRNAPQNQRAPNYRGLDNTPGNSRYSNYPTRH